MRGPPGGSGGPLLNPLDATSVLGKGRRLSVSATTRLCELTDRRARYQRPVEEHQSRCAKDPDTAQ